MGVHIIKLLAILLTISACGSGTPELPKSMATTSPLSSQVIYGEDNRTEFTESLPKIQREIANATVGIFSSSDLEERSHNYIIQRKTYGKSFGLCEGEAFYKQQLGPRCTGVLVASDLILTAGHCVNEERKCSEEYVFNFNFKQLNGLPASTSLEKYNSYYCKDVIFRLDQQIGDLALVQLDRPVFGVEPVSIFQSAKELSYAYPVGMAGYPSGLPLKLVGDSQVLSKMNSSFKANLDAFGGNSGSPVFSLKTGGLLGILIKGEYDFVEDESGCKKEQRCNEYNCTGELVSSIDNVMNIIDEYRRYRKLPNANNPKPQKPSIYSSFIPVEVPDGDYMGVYSHIHVHEVPDARKVSIGIDLEHEWIGDLKIVLHAPGLEPIKLRHLKASVDSKLKGVFGFDLVSDQSLDVLKSVDSEGVWKLQLIDFKLGDKGKLKSWRVIFN